MLFRLLMWQAIFLIAEAMVMGNGESVHMGFLMVCFVLNLN